MDIFNNFMIFHDFFSFSTEKEKTVKGEPIKIQEDERNVNITATLPLFKIKIQSDNVNCLFII